MTQGFWFKSGMKIFVRKGVQKLGYFQNARKTLLKIAPQNSLKKCYLKLFVKKSWVTMQKYVSNTFVKIGLQKYQNNPK